MALFVASVALCIPSRALLLVVRRLPAASCAGDLFLAGLWLLVSTPLARAVSSFVTTMSNTIHTDGVGLGATLYEETALLLDGLPLSYVSLRCLQL